MKSLRIGVVGAGANTRLRHLPGFQAIDGVSVDVVCNRSESSSRSVAEAFGIPRIAQRWEDVVADSEIDAVCIGTWPYLHAPIAIAALEAGKHVLTEARMAMNAEEAEQMLAAAIDRPELVAQVVPSPFTLKWDKTVQSIVAASELGELREITFHKSVPMNVDSAAPLNWRQDERLSGNNTLMLGIYYEVVQRWLGRDPERVSAHGAIFTKERREAAGGGIKQIKIPETLSGVADFEDGLRLSYLMSGLELGRSVDQFTVCGSRGTLRLDLREGTLYQTTLGQTEKAVTPTAEDAGDWRVEADFVDSIREGKPVELTSFEAGLGYMRFTDAVVRSVHGDGTWEAL